MIARFSLFAVSILLLNLPLPCGAQPVASGSTSAVASDETAAVASGQTNTNNAASRPAPGSTPGIQVRNGLPPVNTDSFVHEAAGHAELIYGDEGGFSAPPFNEFTQEHRIEAGITGVRAQGLTDGKASLLPNAWGGDEFCKPEPFSIHGQTEETNVEEPAVPAGRFKM